MQRKILTALLIAIGLASIPSSALAQVVPAQNQVTQGPYGGIAYSTSTSGTAKLGQIKGGTYGDLLYWNGSVWATIATSSLGFTGGVSSVFGRTGAVVAASGDYAAFYSPILVFSYPLVNTGNTISLAFGTTTSNLWAGTQTFTNAPIFSSLTGLLKGNGSSALTVAANGTDYTLITAKTCTLGDFVSAVTAAGVFTCTTPAGTTYTGSFPIAVTGSVISFTGLSTSTAGVPGNIPYFSSANTFANVATSTLTATSPLTGSFTHIGTTGSLGCQTASGSQAGCLASADWTTFNGKQAAGNYITALTGDVTATGPGSVAATLATVNGNVGTFNTLTVNGKGLVTAASNTSYENPLTFSWPLTRTTNTIAFAGLSTTTPWTGSGVAFRVSDSQISTVATTTASCSGSTSCSSFTILGSSPVTISSTASGITALGSGYSSTTGNTITFSTSTLSFNGLIFGQTIVPAAGSLTFTPTVTGTLGNAGLTNSTISGVALGGTLNALTATNGTLTFSGSYDGTTARTVGLNLINANVWTALQQFSNASSTLFSNTGTAYFGGTATTTIDSGGNITIPSTASFTLTGRLNGCAFISSAVLGSTGTTCGTVTGVTGTYPVQSTGGAAPAISLAFGTTTSNTWAKDQTFTNGLLFVATSSPFYQEGRLVYDSGNKSLTFFNGDSQVSLQIGQEEWTMVMNSTGSTIANGAAVYINGASGVLPTVALADATDSTKIVGLGLATEAITNGSVGFVTTIGVVHGVNTSGFLAGANVFVSAVTPGGLTSTAPTSPNYRYRVGVVVVSDATVGSIEVTPSTAAIGNGTAGQFLGINTLGRQAFLSYTYPLLSTGTGVSLDFSTTTANTWALAQTFTSGFANNATSTGTFGINLSGGCFAIAGICVGGSAYTATYPIRLTGNTFSLAFGTTTDNTWSGKNNFAGGLGVGSSTPWAMLAVASSSYNGIQPMFSVATSSDASGALFDIYGTSTSNLASIATNWIESGVRAIIGGIGKAFTSSGILDQFYVNGRIYQDWGYAACDGLSIPATTLSNIASVCGSFAATVVTASGATVGVNAASVDPGVFYSELIFQSTVGPNAGGTGIELGGQNWLIAATNTPVMEVTGRINPTGTTANAAIYIGYTNQTKSAVASLGVTPTSGCYLTASSTQANWKAVCVTASTFTIVDTGVASSSSATAIGAFYKFRVQMDNSKADFWIQNTQNGGFNKVARITTNVPSAVAVAPIVNASVLTSGTGNARFQFVGFRVWWQRVLPQN